MESAARLYSCIQYLYLFGPLYVFRSFVINCSHSLGVFVATSMFESSKILNKRLEWKIWSAILTSILKQYWFSNIFYNPHLFYSISAWIIKRQVMIFHLKIDCKIDIYKPLQQNNFFENLPLRYLSPRQYSPTMQLLHVNVLDWYKVVDKTRTRTANFLLIY